MYIGPHQKDFLFPVTRLTHFLVKIEFFLPNISFFLLAALFFAVAVSGMCSQTTASYMCVHSSLLQLTTGNTPVR